MPELAKHSPEIFDLIRRRVECKEGIAQRLYVTVVFIFALRRRRRRTVWHRRQCAYVFVKACSFPYFVVMGAFLYFKISVER
jgi:hypothetical protein